MQTFPGRAFILLAYVFVFCQSASATLFDINLIQNGDAEAGNADNWSITAGNLDVATSGSWGTTPPPDGGAYMFWGGRGERFSQASQTIDISDLSGFVDTGSVDFDLSGYFGGWRGQDDQSILKASFFDDSQNLLSSYEIGYVTGAERGNRSIFLFEEFGGNVVAGTRSVEMQLTMQRYSGWDNDGYSDNLSFSLSRQPVPEPATMLLFGTGLAGLAFYGRKKSGLRQY